MCHPWGRAGDGCSAAHPPPSGTLSTVGPRGHGPARGYVRVASACPRSTGNGCSWDVQKAEQRKPVTARSYLLVARRWCLEPGTALRALTLRGGESQPK